jgi:hypothetical protein
MDKNTIYSEILYLGFVFEKGRISKKKWSLIYKKHLGKQIVLWNKAISLMNDVQMTEEDVFFFKNFIEFCECSNEVKNIYSCTYPRIKEYEKINFADVTSVQDHSAESKVLIKLMNDMICEIDTLLALNKLFTPVKEIYILLNALHNIPRFFRDQPIDGKNKIDFKMTIEYTLSNMNDQRRSKYSSILKPFLDKRF